MNFIDQWQAKREFQKAVKNLDVSGGIPLSAAEQATKDSDLETYLCQLAKIDLGLKETLPQPRKVFYGEATGLQHAALKKTRRDFPPQSPPRTTYQAELGILTTAQVEPTLAHITRLAAFNLQIDPKDQEALVSQTMDSLKEHRNSSFTNIGDDWTLRLTVEDGWRNNSWITPRLIPIPKKEYSADWINQKTRNLKMKIRPENLSEQVDRVARKNFCVRDVALAEIEPFDVGGNDRMGKIIQKAGYLKTESDDASDYKTIARTPAIKIYCHQDSESDKRAPLLGVEKSVYGDNIFRLLAIVPHALSEDIKSGFQKRFQIEAGKIVKDRIKTGLKSGQDINLNPDGVTTETLNKLEHHIVSADYHDQLDWLCSIALGETLKELANYPKTPKTKDAAALLNQARKLSAAAQKIDDVLAEGSDEDERYVMFDLGWKPDEVSMVFPAAWLAKVESRK